MRLRVLATTVLTGLALLLGAGSASAHAALVSSSPEDGSSIEQGPDQVLLTFNEKISPNFATVTVVGPDDNLWSKGEVVVDGSTVSIDVGELGPVGQYQVAFRVTSADGHVVNGIRTFNLTQEGSGTPGESVAVDVEEDSGSSILYWLIPLVVVVFAVALVFALRRPKKD